MSWAEVILLVLAILGWMAALWLWTERPRPVPSVSSDPILPASEAEHTTVLMDVNGRIESVRRRRGQPPGAVYRAHGKDRPATRYRFVALDGDRAVYRAEA